MSAAELLEQLIELRETIGSNLLEQIIELRETIGSNPRPDDFVGEWEDLAALEAQYRAVTTESQRKAVNGEGGGMVNFA